MGKSHVARMFTRYGIAVLDSDREVHRLYAPGGRAVVPILDLFPGAGTVAGGIDRAQLGRMVLDDGRRLKMLEAAVHGLVREAQLDFLRCRAQAGCWLTVLDVPLLFETRGDARCDRVVVVGSSRFMQRQRALRRPGMTSVRLAAILAKQVPDGQKRARADFVIRSGADRGAVAIAVAEIIRNLRCQASHAWPRRWLGPNTTSGA